MEHAPLNVAVHGVAVIVGRKVEDLAVIEG
jgi:hypothetical protein